MSVENRFWARFVGGVVGLFLLCACSPNIEPIKARYGIQNADSYNSTFLKEYESLLKAVAKRSEQAVPLQELAYFYQANLLLKEALLIYSDLVESSDPKPEWYYYAARAAIDLGDQERALEYLLKSVAIDESYALTRFYLGEVHLKLGELQKAEEAYLAYLETGWEKAYGCIGLARVEIAREDWERAEVRALNALRNDSKIVSAYTLLTNIYRKLGRDDKLQRVQRAAVNGERYHQPKDKRMEALYAYCLEPYRLSVIASVLEASGRAEEGLSFLRKALEINPGNARLLFQLAEGLKRVGRPEEALPLLEKAIAFDSMYESAHYAYVSELEAKGDYEAALEASAKAVEQAGEASGLWRQRAVLLEKADRLGQAERAFRKAVEMEPTESKNQTALANFLWARGRKAEAVERYKEVRKLSPIEAKSRAILAAHYLERKAFNEAIECIEEAVAIDPKLDGLSELKTRWFLLSGSACMVEGDLDAASARFKSGLECDPEHLDLMARLVAVYLEQGEMEPAREVAKRALAAHPRSGMAHRLMAGIEMKEGNPRAAQAWMSRAQRLSD